MQRSLNASKEQSLAVEKIISGIKKRGDKAIEEKYKKRLNSYAITVSKLEIQNAYKEVDDNFLRAVKQASQNITKVSKSEYQSLAKQKAVTTSKGTAVWREWRPIETVGLYIPGGKAIYPSSVLMTAIPAKIAGCQEIIMCTPPNEKGKVPSPTLVAADVIGIKKIFKVGGAEAIGAMNYGTKTIPRVSKVFGAGNSYVTEAKMQVFGNISIDMPAGPSEIFIIADETANPAFVAADLLADAEHGEDSGCVLLTTSKDIAEKVVKEIQQQIKFLQTSSRIKQSLKNYGLIAVVDTIQEAIKFCNDYAPEHLEIMTRNPEVVASQIINAGSVFLGDWTTKSAGDYATGANHVLPTGGMAKMFWPLSVESYGKLVQFQKVKSKKALREIKNTIETFGEIENLPAHKNATSIRFMKGGEKNEKTRETRSLYEGT